MKSVLVVKIEAPNYSSNGIIRAFKDHFEEVHEFDWQKIKFNLGSEEMRRRLMGMAMMHKPQLIFLHLQNPDALDTNTIEFLSKEIGFVVNYTFDCRDMKRTKWMYDMAPEIGWTLFSNQEDVNYCKAVGITNCSVMQSSCDMDVYKPFDNTIDDYVYENRISFIGTNYIRTNLNFPLAQERVDMVQMLESEFSDNFLAYGMGWRSGKLFTSFDERSVYSATAIGINHNNFNCEMYTSDRLWRIMACGCFCLTKHFKGIETLFERGIHLDWWSDLSELKEKIKYYLNAPKERKYIANKGCELVREHHTWSKRVLELKNLINGRDRSVEDISKSNSNGLGL